MMYEKIMSRLEDLNTTLDGFECLCRTNEPTDRDKDICLSLIHQYADDIEELGSLMDDADLEDEEWDALHREAGLFRLHLAQVVEAAMEMLEAMI